MLIRVQTDLYMISFFRSPPAGVKCAVICLIPAVPPALVGGGYIMGFKCQMKNLLN